MTPLPNPNPLRLCAGKTPTATDAIAARFAVADELFAMTLDKLAARFKKSAPDFFSAYDSARVIVDAASARKPAAPAPVPANGAPHRAEPALAGAPGVGPEFGSCACANARISQTHGFRAETFHSNPSSQPVNGNCDLEMTINSVLWRAGRPGDGDGSPAFPAHTARQMPRETCNSP